MRALLVTSAIALLAADVRAQTCTTGHRCVTTFYDPGGAITPRLAITGDDVFFADSGNVFAVSKSGAARCVTSTSCAWPNGFSHIDTAFAIGGAYLYAYATRQRVTRTSLATGTPDLDVAPQAAVRRRGDGLAR